MKLAIASDAISADFETAVLLGLEWGIEYFELKRVHHKRIPGISEDEVAQVVKVLKTHAVKLSTLSPGLFRIPLKQDLIERELDTPFSQSVTLADRLGTRSIIIFGFTRDTDRTEADAIRQIIDVFGALAIRAEREGVQLFLENDRNLWAQSPASLLAIMQGVRSPSLKLNWDPGNLIGAHPDKPFPTGYELIRKFVGHVHVKDAGVDAEGRMVHAMMGSGAVDWVGQFQQLLEDDYQGFCVIEPHFGSRVESSRNHILETRKLLRIARTRHENSTPSAARPAGFS